jgi:hypothetical protein
MRKAASACGAVTTTSLMRDPESFCGRNGKLSREFGRWCDDGAGVDELVSGWDNGFPDPRSGELLRGCNGGFRAATLGEGTLGRVGDDGVDCPQVSLCPRAATTPTTRTRRGSAVVRRRRHRRCGT